MKTVRMFAVAVCLFGPAFMADGLAQSPKSKVGLTPFNPPSDQPTDVDDIRRLLAGLLSGNNDNPYDLKKLKDFAEQLKKQQNGDPEQLKKLLNDHPQFKDPAFLDMLQKMSQSPDFMEGLKKQLGNGDISKLNWDQLTQQLQQWKSLNNGQGLDFNQLAGGAGNTGNGGNIPKVDWQGKFQDYSKGMPKIDSNQEGFAKWMQNKLGDSPGMQDTLKKMTESMSKGMNQPGFLNNLNKLQTGTGSNLFNKLSNTNTNFGKINFPKLGGSTAGGWKLKFGGGGSGGGGWGGSGGGGGGGISFGGGGGGGGGAESLSAVGIVIGVIGGGILLWLLFRKLQLNRLEVAGSASILPSHIRFDMIRTRQELVDAFDQLTLKDHGEAARIWNHRTTADQFGAIKPSVEPNVMELSELYERARYAPADEDLSGDEYASARRDLTAVAGAARA